MARPLYELRRHLLMAEYVTVIPAYGRDYKTKKEVIEAWNDGKDFQIVDMFHGNGRYISKRDVIENPSIVVNVRYKRQTLVAVMPRGNRKTA